MHKGKFKMFTGIILAIFALMGIILSPVTSLKISASENYRQWRQFDSQWGSIKLGEGNCTMANSGCLVTAIAIMAVYSGSENPDNFNPGTFANSLNAINAFSDGAIASWASITKVIPDVKFVEKYTFTSSDQKGKAAEMKSFMDKGYYVICNVGGHHVFVEAISGSDVLMIDPAKNDTNLFSAYNNSGIVDIRVFSGKNAYQSTTSASTSPTTATRPPVVSTITTMTTAAPTTESYKIGEYFASAGNYIGIFTSPESGSGIIEYLSEGQIVNVISVKNGMGCVQLGAENGWINMKYLSYAGEPEVHKTGDINNDGRTDRLDLALLNEYISSLSELPDGISILRECEINAADINGDGTVDNNDAIAYLAIICK